MSSAKQNRSIAKLIVGAMTIDGSLDKKEREKTAQTLEKIGMGELIADVGAAMDEDDGHFNLFQECKTLLELLGPDKDELVPLIFRVVADIVASDRFVSAREAAYLSSMGKRLNLPPDQARGILKQVMAERRGRLEISGKNIDENINPQLKDLLSFTGADKLVGEATGETIEELAESATSALAEGEAVSTDELSRALTILGLDKYATMDDAKQVWRETIDNLDLPKMADLGETFVSAAINRITRINQAYKTVRSFHDQAAQATKKNLMERLAKA